MHKGHYRVVVDFSDGERKWTVGEVVPSELAQTWPNLSAMLKSKAIVPADDGSTDFIVLRDFPNGSNTYSVGDVVPRQTASTWPNLGFLVAHEYLEHHKAKRGRGRPRKRVDE